MKVKRFVVFMIAIVLMTTVFGAPVAYAEDGLNTIEPLEDIHPSKAGEVMLFKDAETLEDTINRWKITLRMEAKDLTAEKTAIAVMFDKSGSLSEELLMEFKETIKDFVSEILPNENVEIGIISFASGPYAGDVNHELSSNRDSLISSIDTIEIAPETSWNTNTQTALIRAETMLEGSDAKNKFAFLMTDGVPTRYSIDGVEEPYTPDYLEFSAEAAFEVAERMKGKGIQISTVYRDLKPYNFSEIYPPKLIMERISSSGSAIVTGNYEAFTKGVQAVTDRITKAMREAVVVDPMGSGFKVSEEQPITVIPSDTQYWIEDGTLYWNPRTLKESLPGQEDIKFAELTYYVETKEGILEAIDDEGLAYTNGDASVTYLDTNQEEVTSYFPKPKVNPVLIQIHKNLLDAKGDTKVEANTFNANLSSGDVTTELSLETKEGIGTPMTLYGVRPVGTYILSEESSEGYDVSYEVKDGDSWTKGNKVLVKSGDEDYFLAITNQEKHGSISLKKELDFPTEDSFTFMITGPKDYQESISLPDEEGSYERVLTNLITGEYTITELDATNYETEIQGGEVLEDDSKSVKVRVSTDDLHQEITFINTHKELFSVTGTKTWVNAPEDRPEIYFQLVRISSDGDELAIGSPRVVEGDTVTWTQGEEYPELLPHDQEGHTYGYVIREVNEKGEDYTPEGYEKVEEGLTITNTNVETVLLAGEKIWEDDHDKHGLRPEMITIHVLSKGKRILSKEVTAKDQWSWEIALPKYKEGQLINYTIEEEVVEGYLSEIKEVEDGFYQVINLLEKEPKVLPRTGQNKALYLTLGGGAFLLVGLLLLKKQKRGQKA